jgi:hypothetical protein
VTNGEQVDDVRIMWLQEKKQKKKRKAEEAAGQKPAGDDWNQGTHAWRPFDRERDLGHAPKPATPAEVGAARESLCMAEDPVGGHSEMQESACWSYPGPMCCSNSFCRHLGLHLLNVLQACGHSSKICTRRPQVLKKAGSLANRFGGGGDSKAGGRTFL